MHRMQIYEMLSCSHLFERVFCRTPCVAGLLWPDGVLPWALALCPATWEDGFPAVK